MPDSLPRIVVVEDTVVDEELTIKAITEIGLERRTAVARDGEQALEILMNNPADLIFLDVRLPKLSGLGVLDWIRHNERLRHVPVVLMSNSEHSEDISAAYERGASGYIFKPIDPDSYISSIKSACLYWLRGRELTVGDSIR